MKQEILIFLSIILCYLLTSCIDLSSQYNIDGPYFVASDPGYGYMALYYDLGDGNAIERVPNIKRVGHTGKFIIAENQEGFYFIDRKKDHKYLNGDEIIGKPRSHKNFFNWLDSLGVEVEEFKFDYHLEK